VPDCSAADASDTTSIGIKARGWVIRLGRTARVERPDHQLRVMTTVTPEPVPSAARARRTNPFRAWF